MSFLTFITAQKAICNKMCALVTQKLVDDVAEDEEALAAAAVTEMVSVRKAAVEAEVTDQAAAVAIERAVIEREAIERAVIADQLAVTEQMLVIAKSRRC